MTTPPPPLNLAEAIELLSRTPATLNALLRGVSEPWARTSQGTEEWTPYDVIGHLVHGEETDWIARLHIILEHGPARPFESFDRFAQFEKSKGVSLDTLLDTFAERRRQNLETLTQLALTPDMLTKTGTHPQLGTVTLGQLLATWVAHDLNHIGQIVSALAHRYRDAVGPWRAYLSILGDSHAA